MDTKSLAYKKAFDAYMRYGTPIALSLEQQALQTKRQRGKPLKRTTTHYIWRTQGDGKVRASHAANDGKIFAWDDPPPTGHPGEDYGCRCIAEPYVPENVNQPVAGRGSSLSDQIDSSDGLFGTRWEFKAGRRIRFEAQSTNVIGVIGVRVYYDIFKLSKAGKVIPQLRNRNSSGKQLGLYVIPLRTRTKVITADFDSPFGYYWIVRAESAQATDNESHIFYRVYR